MATKKNILTQSQDFVRESEDRQILRELQSKKNNDNLQQNEKGREKPKTKAQRIKDKRPLQVSIHFTQEEKFAMEDARTLAKRMGISDATVEDFVHGVVVAGLRSIKDNGELLKMIFMEDENLRIE